MFVQGNDEEKATGRLILVEVLEAMRIVAVLLSPVTPSLSEAIYLQLGYNSEAFRALTLKDAEWGGIIIISVIVSSIDPLQTLSLLAFSTFQIISVRTFDHVALSSNLNQRLKTK